MSPDFERPAEAGAFRPSRRTVLLATAGTVATAFVSSCSSDEPLKVEQVLDAVEHGVPVDGGRDGAAKLQALLDEAASTGAGVRIPEGATVGLSRTLRVPDGTALVGPGGLRSLRRMSSLLVIGSGAGGVRLTDLALDGSNRVSGPLVAAGPETTGLQVVGCSLRSANTGIHHAGGGRDTVVADCNVERVVNGVKVTGAVRGFTVKRTKFRAWKNRGVWIVGDAKQAPHEITIDRNEFLPPSPDGTVRQPIQINGHDDQLIRRVTITGNRVQGSGTAYEDEGRPGAADLISLHRCRDFVVADNHVSRGGDVGITVSRQCEDGEVRGNVCADNDSVGIAIGSRPSEHVRRVSVTGNKCIGNAQDRLGTGREWTSCGILVVKASDITVRDNTLRARGPKSQAHGVVVWDSERVSVSDNQIVASAERVKSIKGSADPRG